MPLYLMPATSAAVLVVRADNPETAVDILFAEMNFHASWGDEYKQARRAQILKEVLLLEPEGEPGVVAETQA